MRCSHDPAAYLAASIRLQRPEYAAMPRYPDDGSVQIIDGRLVVKVQEEYTPKSDFEIAYENRR